LDWLYTDLQVTKLGRGIMIVFATTFRMGWGGVTGDKAHEAKLSSG